MRLEPELHHLAFGVLRKLCGRIGHLPESYFISDKIDLSGVSHASSNFTDIRMGVFRGENVAVKSLIVSEMDNKARIRKVGNQVTSSQLGSLTHRTALL